MLFENKPTIALTGATGFLGSHLMASLLSGGYKIIILGRSNKKESLNERISRLLRWFGIVELAGHLEFVEIDFLKPLLGIPEAEYIWLCEKTELIIHCASDTSFTERKREIVFKSNVNSLEGILDFAVNAQVKFFHYISTAYVAGANITVCKERLSSSSDFINVYEESKALAENIIANNDGKKSKQSGIFLDEEGYLFLPLRIFLPKEGALNIIPVDYFVNATMKIIARASPGGIYHLTNNSHTKLESIAEYNEQFMKIRGVEIVYGKPVDNDLRNPVEELFDRFVEPYRPYLSDNRIFERENTDILTDNLQPPVFSFEIFEKCMEYAISVNWGQSIL